MVRLLLRGVHSIWPGSQVYLYSSRSWGHRKLLVCGGFIFRVMSSWRKTTHRVRLEHPHLLLGLVNHLPAQFHSLVAHCVSFLSFFARQWLVIGLDGVGVDFRLVGLSALWVAGWAVCLTAGPTFERFKRFLHVDTQNQLQATPYMGHQLFLKVQPSWLPAAWIFGPILRNALLVNKKSQFFVGQI